MSERDRRTGTGGAEDNVKDELDDAAKKDATKEAVEEEEATGGPEGNESGGTKGNVQDELDETQKH
ncbi:MAG: hypothetical protein ACR2HO_00960 [Rubrobacteraceae bacterium]|jgi:hypothetical protein